MPAAALLSGGAGAAGKAAADDDELIVGLSVSLPPTVDAKRAAAALRLALEEDPPDGASVTLTTARAVNGWSAAPHSAWLASAIDQASAGVFGERACGAGRGAAVASVAMLRTAFPQAELIVRPPLALCCCCYFGLSFVLPGHSVRLISRQD